MRQTRSPSLPGNAASAECEAWVAGTLGVLTGSTWSTCPVPVPCQRNPAGAGSPHQPTNPPPAPSPLIHAITGTRPVSADTGYSNFSWCILHDSAGGKANGPLVAGFYQSWNAYQSIVARGALVLIARCTKPGRWPRQFFLPLTCPPPFTLPLITRLDDPSTPDRAVSETSHCFGICCQDAMNCIASGLTFDDLKSLKVSLCTVQHFLLITCSPILSSEPIFPSFSWKWVVWTKFGF